MGCFAEFFLFIFIMVGIGLIRIWWTFHSLVKKAQKQQEQQQKPHFEGEGVYRDTTDKKASQNANKKKMFDDNEGEYVEFEEVKDK